MQQTRSILLVSTEGPKLEKIISSDSAQKHLAIQRLADERQLFTRISQHAYSLLIIDLSLLVRSVEAGSPMARLKAAAPGMATLLLLANQDEREQAITLLQQGVADYLLFPLHPAELLLKIGRILAAPAPTEAASQSPPLDSAGAELQMLHQASQEISRTLQLGEALKIVLAKASQVTKANLARIYLVAKSGDLIKDSAVTETSVQMSQASDDDLLFNLASQAAFTQQVVCRHDVTDPARPDQSLRSALLIPLLSGEKLMGVLALGNKQLSAFSSNQIRWLSVFCGQAAIAIENASLFQDLSSAYIDLAKNRESIIDSRNTLRALFDGITDGVYLLDKDLTINVVNQIEAERQGYQPAELVGQSFQALGWTRAAPELLERIRESLQQGRKTTWISPEHEKEPYLKDREFRIYPIRNRLAQIEQVIVFAQDVSERRRWQVSLFHSANLAAVGQLAGSVAHQINNPLTITMTNSQLLLLEIAPDTEAYELATDIFKAGERIQNIVTNLLEFSNQETYFFTQVDLIDTIEGALALVIRSLKKARIDVVKDYQAEVILSASVSHLKLVWMNLLLNARDAVMEASQPRITISTRPVSEREVSVAITDNGCGIPEKDFEMLFRPFFTTKPARRALGLGLYSAHTIVEHHNGQIKVSSQPHLATTVEVVLPLDNPRDL